MQIVGDRIAFDSAYELEWLELTDSKSALSSDETYAAMIQFLELYRSQGEGDTKDISRLLDELTAEAEKYQGAWDRVVQQVIHSD